MKNTFCIQLHKALKQKDFNTVKLLLQEGANPNCAFDNGKTPIIHAAFNNHLEIVKLLIQYNANINKRDDYGGTALYWAVCGAYFDMVKLLIAHGANINIKNNDGQSPFMRSVSGINRPGHVDILKFFLKLGADVNQADDGGVTPLMQAAGGGYEEVTKILLENDADVTAKTKRGETALVMACRSSKENPAVVKMLIEAGAEIDAKDQRGIHVIYLAAQNGHTEIIEILLDEGLDINWNNGLIIRTAASNSRLDTVKLLIKKSADVDAADEDNRTALMIAVSLRQNEMARLLIDAGADVNAVTTEKSWGGARTVLMFALGIEDGYLYERCIPPKVDPKLIELILDKGADVNYKNKSGITALKMARHKKHKVVGLLKKRGAKE